VEQGTSQYSTDHPCLLTKIDNNNNNDKCETIEPKERLIGKLGELENSGK